MLSLWLQNWVTCHSGFLGFCLRLSQGLNDPAKEAQVSLSLQCHFWWGLIFHPLSSHSSWAVKGRTRGQCAWFLSHLPQPSPHQGIPNLWSSYKPPLPSKLESISNPRKSDPSLNFSILFSGHPSPTKSGIQPKNCHYVLWVGTFVPHLHPTGIHPRSSLLSNHLSILKVRDIFMQSDTPFCGLCWKHLDCSTYQRPCIIDSTAPETLEKLHLWTSVQHWGAWGHSANSRFVAFLAYLLCL